MRVLHVIPAIASRYGGPSSSIVEMCRALVDAGIDVRLATTDADGPGRLDVPVETVATWRGIDTLFFSRQWTESFKYSRPLARWLSAHVIAFDVVHIHAVLSHASLAAAAASRRAGVPYVVRPLGTLDPWSLGQKGVRKRVLMSLVGSRLVRDAAALHYTSTEERRSVESTLHTTRGVVIPLGVDPSWLNRSIAGETSRSTDRYVLVLSRLHPVKNLEAFIGAFADVSAMVPGWRLVIAGSGAPGYVQALEQAVNRTGARDRIAFTGWVDGEPKRELIARASLFALPSLHENFGVSLVEALASGVPAFVSRQVHLAEAIEASGAGWVADVGVQSIRDVLCRALKDVTRRDEMGRAARDFARRFAWPIIATELSQLYTRIATRSHGETMPIAAARGLEHLSR